MTGHDFRAVEPQPGSNRGFADPGFPLEPKNIWSIRCLQPPVNGIEHPLLGGKSLQVPRYPGSGGKRLQHPEQAGMSSFESPFPPFNFVKQEPEFNFITALPFTAREAIMNI